MIIKEQTQPDESNPGPHTLMIKFLLLTLPNTRCLKVSVCQDLCLKFYT